MKSLGAVIQYTLSSKNQRYLNDKLIASQGLGHGRDVVCSLQRDALRLKRQWTLVSTNNKRKTPMRMRPLVRMVSLALLIGGVSTAAQAQIAVGHLADYSGPTSDVGAAYGQAVADTFAWVNRNGGVGGKQLSVDTGDYGYQVPRAICAL
jgi:Periplasmic binding protein